MQLMISRRLRSNSANRKYIRGTEPVLPLEKRQLFTAIVVNSLTDGAAVTGNVTSLRAAINIANASTADTTITFDPTVFSTPQTISLTNGALAIQNFNESTTIVGPSVGVTISGTNAAAIFNDTASTLSLSNMTITQGSVGVSSLNANIMLNNVSVIGNAGDGIDAQNGLTLTNSTVAKNGLVNGGEGITVTSGPDVSVTLFNDTITGNDTNGATFGGSALLINDTISGNTQLGIISTTGQVTLGNTVIAGNSLFASGLFSTIGGDLSVNLTSYGTIPPASPIKSLGNNFIGNAFNTATEAADGNWLTSDSIGVRDNGSGAPISVIRPLLGPLTNNGGLTLTMLPQPGSPLINGGSNALIPAGVTTDQRGLSRTFGGVVDIGAVQLNTIPQLAGIPIGTPGSWDGSSTIQQVFDGNLNTFFDPPATSSMTAWVGLDLGVNATLTQIKFAPRAGEEFRMLGGQFQVSSTPDFSSNVQTLYTVTSTPTAGVLTTVAVHPTAGFRYVRYTGGTQWVNIAEMQVFGQELSSPPVAEPFEGTVIGVGGAWDPQRTITAAVDGNPYYNNNGSLNLNTFFDPANGNLTNWVGLDLGTPQRITLIAFAPRAGYEFRMLGGQFQVSSTADFSSDVHTVYTVTAAPTAGQLTTVSFPAVGAYRYVRYTGGTQWVNIAEMEFAGPLGSGPMTGTAIGTAASWNANSSITAAFDGSTSTFFDPANGNLTNWVGLDLGSAKTITQIKYVGRDGYEFRMVGAQIQVSSTADFSSDVHTIYTVTSAPATGQVVTLSVSPVTYRYIRYVGGTQWVNIAELEVDGF